MLLFNVHFQGERARMLAYEYSQCRRFCVLDIIYVQYCTCPTCSTGTWDTRKATKQLPELAAKIRSQVLVKVFRCIFPCLFQWYSEMLVLVVNQRHKNWQGFRNAGTFVFKRQIIEYVYSASHSGFSVKSYHWLPYIIISANKRFAWSIIGKI